MAELLGSIRALLPQAQSHCTLGVISTLPGEGVSTIARGLANAAANSERGRVLLCSAQSGVDRSTERPPFLFMETVPGPNDDSLSYGQVEGDQLVRAVSGDADHGRSIVKSLTQSFSLAIIELPPVSRSTIGAAMTKALDGVILVVEAERTRAHALRATRKSIERYGGNILGVVFNKRRHHIPESIYRWL